MSIEYVGRNFIEVVDDQGARQLIRVSAIQRVGDSDPMQNESIVIVAGQMLMVQSSVDEFREVLEQQFGTGI